MLKKVTALFLVLLLSSTSFPVMASAAEVGSLDNFQIINSYTQGQYKDVPETNTFAANIKTAVTVQQGQKFESSKRRK